MVEGSRIDHAGHINHLQRNVQETLEFDRTIKALVEWMGNREDTLILVTADHETGGLMVTGDNGAGNYPTVTWSTLNHTGVPVPVYAIGLNAHLATNITVNTQIHTVSVSDAVVPEKCISTEINETGFHMIWTSSSNDVYRIEDTPVLEPADWQTVDTYTSSATRLTVSITNLPTTPKRFYQMISL